LRYFNFDQEKRDFIKPRTYKQSFNITFLMLPSLKTTNKETVPIPYTGIPARFSTLTSNPRAGYLEIELHPVSYEWKLQIQRSIWQWYLLWHPGK
jgi:hypothetical protein